MIKLPLIVMLLGILIYLLAKPEARGGRVVRVGEIAFFVGLVFTVWLAGAKALL